MYDSVRDSASTYSGRININNTHQDTMISLPMTNFEFYELIACFSQWQEKKTLLNISIVTESKYPKALRSILGQKKVL
jgi:hypothetical protein